MYYSAIPVRIDSVPFSYGNGDIPRKQAVTHSIITKTGRIRTFFIEKDLYAAVPVTCFPVFLRPVPSFAEDGGESAKNATVFCPSEM